MINDIDIIGTNDTSFELDGLDADPRLTKRADTILEKWRRQPGLGFPQIFSEDAESEGLYRFFNNPQITFEKLLAPQVKQTVGRLSPGDVLCLHDTTEFKFSGAKRRKGLGRLTKGGQGFFGHFTLAVSADGERFPYGPVAADLYTRAWQIKGRRETAARRKEADKESSRWLRGVERAEEAVAGAARLIHVMDREGDIYPLVAKLVANRLGFVNRCCQNRCIAENEQQDEKLFDALDGLPVLTTITAHVSYRPENSLPGRQKIHPPRVERDAVLAVTATTVELKRPANAPKDWPPTTPVNLVHVFEPEPPSDQEAIEWILLTSEPVDSVEAVLRVVEIYRARWVIEEFFKSLKTGCAIEKRQLQSYHALTNALGMALPIACEMLALRTLTQHAPETPAEAVICDVRLKILRTFSKRHKVPANPNVKHVLYAIAGLGGYLKRKQPPGWITLRRGYTTLLLYEQAWCAAIESCDQP
jgi:hypothetical protein